MKRLIAVVLAVVLLASLGGVALAGNNLKGNGAPNGPHYNLNLIGMKFDDMNKECEPGGHVIFIRLGKHDAAKTTRILLSEGAHETDFYVEDCDGTDGTAAFRLPNPDPTNSGTTQYSVFLRVLGSPKNNPSIIMETCATDPLTDEEICSDEKVVEVRTKGKKSFTNVSKELLYIYAWVCTAVDPITGDCTNYEYMRVPLFSDILEDYLWQTHNKGVRLVQLRFYYNYPTTVPDPVEPS
jgi:hypothetical protein